MKIYLTEAGKALLNLNVLSILNQYNILPIQKKSTYIAHYRVHLAVPHHVLGLYDISVLCRCFDKTLARD